MSFSRDQEATIIIPSAGRHAACPQALANHGGPEPKGSRRNTVVPDEYTEPSSTTERNRLIQAAKSLLLAGARIRTMSTSPNLNDLQENLLSHIGAFETASRKAGVTIEQNQFARYLLCTFVDESVAITHWGAAAGWNRHSLLVRLHNDGWGGEKCFRYLERLLIDPGRHIELIELFYVCICLGFEGQYRIRDEGAPELEVLRRNLYEVIRKQRGDGELDLATQWRGAIVPSMPKNGLQPVWAAAVAGLAVMVVAFSTFLFLLNGRSDAIAWNALHLSRPKVPVTAMMVQAKPVKRLAGFLEKEITQGLIEVRETDRESVITFRGDGLFEPGSASPKPIYSGVIHRVGTAMDDVPGMIIVSGHTDSQQMRSARYPSNWHLSKARAEAVLTMLKSAITDLNRLSAEGLGDTQPVAANDTPINRAKNRRVEVTLRLAGL